MEYINCKEVALIAHENHSGLLERVCVDLLKQDTCVPTSTVQHHLSTQDTALNKITPRELSELNKLMPSHASYQPLYGVDTTEFKLSGVREISDRAKLLLENINTRDLAYGSVKILDVGTWHGYIPFYFADRGATATGIDRDGALIKNSNYLKTLNGLTGADFATADFNAKYVGNLQKNYFTHAVVFSVFHHINSQHGLPYTQQLIGQLVEKIPTVFVELAVKEEVWYDSWVKALPEKPETFFDLCKCDYKLIGYGKTGHLDKKSTAQRPIYKLTRKGK